MKKKLLFINNMAAPYQIKFCYALQEYYNTEFWFYIHLEKNRPTWWSIPLGDKCRVLNNSFFIPVFNYNNLSLLKMVKQYDPDILMLGGFFMPGHYILKRWAKKNGKKIVILAERISLPSTNKFKRNIKIIIKKLNHSFFKNIDLLLAMGEFPKEQYINQFSFDKRKVVLAQYPQDIDSNLLHPLRKTKSNATLIFPNRLDKSYNPIFALNVFLSLVKDYPNLILKMNTMGELKEECKSFITAHNLSKNVIFLDDISSWDELSNIYLDSDIALFTATDSNGPNSLIESMASGCGIVLSKYILNTSSYAIHKKNCFRCDLDINEFSNAIRKYLEIPNLIETHGKQAKIAVENRSVKATADLYYKLLN